MKYLIAAAAPLALAACASLQPEPCTTEWVEWKTDQVLTPFARDNRGLIRDLRDFSQDMRDPGPITLMLMASKLDDFRDLATDFQDDVLPELRAAVDTCGEPAQFVPAFTGFLRKQGVEEDMLVWIDAIGAAAAAQSDT